MSSDEVFIARLLRALSETHLEALIVGSMAAAMQGVPLLTQYIDLLIRDTPPNRAKLESLARLLGAAAPALISPLTPVVRIIGADVAIDILFDELSGGLRFEALRSRSLAVPIADQVARVACLDDVIASKAAAGRPKDLAQLPVLRDAARVRAAARGVGSGGDPEGDLTSGRGSAAQSPRASQVDAAS